VNYNVIWRPKALRRLQRLWMASTNPQAVLDASYRLTAQIRVEPRNTGESRQGDLRLAFDPPLALLFRIDPNNRDVIVVNVGKSRP